MRMTERKSGMRTSETDGRNTVRKDEGKGWEGNSLQEPASVGSQVAGHRGLLKVITSTQRESHKLRLAGHDISQPLFWGVCAVLIPRLWEGEPHTHG